MWATNSDASLLLTHRQVFPFNIITKQRFLTPGHQGWNDLHSLCRIGMEYYLLNNDDNNIIYWIMMIIIDNDDDNNNDNNDDDDDNRNSNNNDND